MEVEDGLIINLNVVFLDCPVKDILNVRLYDESSGLYDVACPEFLFPSTSVFLEGMSKADDIADILKVIRTVDQANL